MKMHVLERKQLVPQPLEAVFPFFATPENLERITPPHLGMNIITPPPIPMREGALFDYIVKLRGLPMRWTTLITDYNPPHRFVDVQLKGPYSFWHHTHTFEETPEGTLLGDRVCYLLPMGPLGSIAHTLFVKRDLESVFAFRRKIIAAEFGTVPGHD
ncbi:MAG: CDP-paratose 2-epimerase [Candidatus Hydrogenedens sp.]|nr:CDP-paratose 2-epimerase [Candidatus Hydrogenedens sp.]